MLNSTTNEKGGGGGGAEEGVVDMEDAKMFLDLDPVDPEKSTLHVPMLILYPMEARSDFIKAVPETETVGEMLGVVLPVPWEDQSQSQSPDPNPHPGLHPRDDSTNSSTTNANGNNKNADDGGERRMKREKEYDKLEKVECFMETLKPSPSSPQNQAKKEGGKRGLIKVGKKIPLTKILGGKAGVVIQDGMVRVFVLPKAKTGRFVEEFKRRRRRT